MYSHTPTVGARDMGDDGRSPRHQLLLTQKCSGNQLACCRHVTARPITPKSQYASILTPSRMRPLNFARTPSCLPSPYLHRRKHHQAQIFAEHRRLRNHSGPSLILAPKFEYHATRTQQTHNGKFILTQGYLFFKKYLFMLAYGRRADHLNAIHTPP
jgi:hypothetical protein